MLYPLAIDYTITSQKQGSQIKSQRPVFQIIFIEFNFDRNWKVIPAVNLCPARYPRYEFVDTLFRSQFNQIILVVQCRPGSYKAHVAFQHAKNLRHFVQTELS